MKTKLLFCLALILSGLAVGGCLTSARLQSQSPAAAQAQFIYSTNAGGTTATITRYKGSSGAVTIPGTIHGLCVTSIGASAFWANPKVTSVIIPDSVTNIGNGAFSAVDSYSSLSNVVIGNGVIAIGRAAFHFCDKLTSIRIPRNVASIGTLAFGGCFRLKQILVDSNNAAYTSVDGVLFNKNQTELVQYPPGKAGDYTIPKTVTNIADYALWNCPKLTGIVIPEGVTTIKKEAFAACGSLTNIIIPASVTNIDLWAFDSCMSLEGVYFRGNAPSHPEYHGYKGVDIYHIFNGDDVAVVYHLPKATGWGRTFNGRPTALWTFSVPTNLALIDEIHNAAKTGDVAKVEALLKSNPELASRKDPNASGYKLGNSLARDWTPLHVAAAYGHKEIAKLLLAKGANVNARNTAGWTPLHMAAAFGHKGVAELLLAKGANVNARGWDWAGWTPLHLAVSNHHLGVADLLLADGANVNATNNFGATSLHYVASMGHKDMAELLLARGANVNARDNLRRTPLTAAAMHGNESVAKVLVARGADINAKDFFDATPLHEAAFYGHSNVVKLLLADGAEVNPVDDLGRTPLAYAASMGHTNVVKLLREHGSHK